jgi:hypothetical protein
MCISSTLYDTNVSTDVMVETKIDKLNNFLPMDFVANINDTEMYH